LPRSASKIGLNNSNYIFQNNLLDEYSESMRNSFRAFLFVFFGIVTACAEKEILDKPLIFDEERKALTLQYLSDRYGLEQSEPTIDPKMIVLHWTVIPTFEASFETFNPAKLPSRPDIKAASALNVSSQFMVDRDGTIYRLLPETTMARHVIGLNHCAIGVENVGGTEDLPLTEAQVEANIWLVKNMISTISSGITNTHFSKDMNSGWKKMMAIELRKRTQELILCGK